MTAFNFHRIASIQSFNFIAIWILNADHFARQLFSIQ